jgi:hypothetical protein
MSPVDRRTPMDDVLRCELFRQLDISIVPDQFEFFEMGFNALVVGAVAGIAGAIDIPWAANIG